MIISRPVQVSYALFKSAMASIGIISLLCEAFEKAAVTSLATSAGFFLLAKMNESTPFGFAKVSNEMNVTWTFDI